MLMRSGSELEALSMTMTYRRIVVFRQGQFGDTLVAFPLLQALRAAFPQVRLTYCTNRFRNRNLVMGDDVASLSAAVDDTAVYYLEDSVFDKWKGLRNQLAPNSGDALLYLPYSGVSRASILRDYLFFKLLGYRNFFGFRDYWIWGGRQERLSLLRRESERLCLVAESLGVQLPPPESCKVLADDIWWNNRREERGLRDKPYLVVCPGSKMQSKRWPLERYAEVLRRFCAEQNFTAVIIGGPEERGLADELARRCPSNVHAFCGETLARSAAIAGNATCYLGNDTGSMHLAAVQGVPCVVVFPARQKPQLWYPHGEGHQILRHDIPCSNCMLEVCYADPAPCLVRTSVDDVYHALSTTWQRALQ